MSLNICMIISSFKPLKGGAEAQAETLSRWLMRHKHEVRVITRRFDNLPAKEVVNTIPVHRIYMSGGKISMALLFIINALIWRIKNRCSFHIYHAHDVSSPAIIGILYKLFFGGKVVVKIRGDIDAATLLFQGSTKRLRMLLTKLFTDQFVAVNRDVYDYFLAQGYQKKISCIPNGVDTHVFSPGDKKNVKQERTLLGLPPDKKIVLYIGRIERVKGVDIVIRAWRMLTLAYPDTVLTIVGAGSEFDIVKRDASDLLIDKKIIFAGQRENVSPWLSCADIFVLPSRSEGLSNALLEAMSCALPVICSAVGGGKELIRNGVNGLLFRPEDEEDLKDKLELLLQDKHNQCDTLGRNARETVENYYSMEKVGKDYEELYRKLV